MTLTRLKLQVLRKLKDNAAVRVEPLYLYGSTLSKLSRDAGHEILRTTDGHAIVAAEMYCVDEHGVFQV